MENFVSKAWSEAIINNKKRTREKHKNKNEKFISILTKAVFNLFVVSLTNCVLSTYESFHGFFQIKVTSPHAGNR